MVVAPNENAEDSVNGFGVGVVCCLLLNEKIGIVVDRFFGDD